MQQKLGKKRHGLGKKAAPLLDLDHGIAMMADDADALALADEDLGNSSSGSRGLRLASRIPDFIALAKPCLWGSHRIRWSTLSLTLGLGP